MASKKPPLRGRGLSDLLAENTYDLLDSGDDGEKVLELKLTDIIANENQPRKMFNEDKIAELSESIKSHGVLQPIIVSKQGNKYRIVAGERRYRASKLIGNETIPAIVRKYDESKTMQLALIENLQRVDLNPVEEAKAYRDIIDYTGITQEQLATSVGKSRSYVTNMLGILNLPESIIEHVYNGELTAGHAKVLSKLDDFENIKKLAAKVISESLSVRKLEELTKEEKKRKEIKKKEESSQYQHVNKELTTKYNANFKVSSKQIVIKAENDIIESIVELLKK